jgi:hypothetical protein
VLFYFAQKVNCDAKQGEVEHKNWLAKRTKLTDLPHRIETIGGRIEEQKVLGNILVYAEQSRTFCELLNALQGIVFRAGEVYLTSFVWSAVDVKGKRAEARPTQKGGKDVKKKATPKKTGRKTDVKAQEVASEAAAVASSICLSWAMFIGDSEMTQDIKHNFNDKANAMFQQIRRLPVCVGETYIKVNAPECQNDVPLHTPTGPSIKGHRAMKNI